MLKTEIIINELDQYLQQSGLYYAEEDKAEELSNEAFEKWNSRFEQAIKDDFFVHTQLNVSFSDVRFELFSDQGASIWWNIIVVKDETASIQLSLGFKAVINHKKNQLTLQEDLLRLKEYSGTNSKARNIFQKLKSAHEDGYEPGITMQALLLE